ncbi:MAG: hypothetical protein JW973_13660 [Bacteroidales bacterium]|nr:hypothetical protein [Bacteroidales bacterium]
MKSNQRIIIALTVFAGYAATMFASNILMEKAMLTQIENYEMLSGVLLGFVGIPLLSIILPLYLANKWKIPYSVWPKTKSAWLVVFILLSYIILGNYSIINSGRLFNYSWSDLTVHYFSSMLFHVTYYPLFAILILGTLRGKLNLTLSIAFTALFFALYHLVQYHFFPGGTTFKMQVVLFIAFIANLLLYLWSESLLLVAMTHSANGAIGLIENGTIFNEIDFVFYLTIVIIIGLFSYLIYKEVLQRKRREYDKRFWLHIEGNKHPLLRSDSDNNNS